MHSESSAGDLDTRGKSSVLLPATEHALHDATRPLVFPALASGRAKVSRASDASCAAGEISNHDVLCVGVLLIGGSIQSGCRSDAERIQFISKARLGI